MPRYARAIGEDGNEYQGETVRKAGGAWAVFHEPANKDYPNGPYVLHRWLPYILSWLPVSSYATEDEARSRMESFVE